MVQIFYKYPHTCWTRYLFKNILATIWHNQLSNLVLLIKKMWHDSYIVMRQLLTRDQMTQKLTTIGHCTTVKGPEMTNVKQFKRKKTNGLNNVQNKRTQNKYAIHQQTTSTEYTWFLIWDGHIHTLWEEISYKFYRKTLKQLNTLKQCTQILVTVNVEILIF